MYILFRFILSLSHFVYNIYDFIQQLCISWMLFVQHRGYLNNIKSSCTYLNSNNHLNETSKIPKHLAILFGQIGQEELSALDLIKFISWCIVAEIPYITLYDQKGILKENESFIKKKLNELEPFINQNIEWPSSNNIIKDTKTVNEANNIKCDAIQNSIIKSNITNGYKKHKTKIQILSYIDCKQQIVDITKNLSKIVEEKDITVELLDEKLRLNIEAPDPELAIIFSKTMCTYGYLPWQSRVTEFFMIPTHHNLSFDTFVRTLRKFGACQQRHGK